MDIEETNGTAGLTLRPYTVSAVYDDGLEALIVHCIAADAQAARDQVIMEKQGRVIIASVFDGHLHEPDSVIFQVERGGERREEEAGSVPA
jgi:hypothetical protein